MKCVTNNFNVRVALFGIVSMQFCVVCVGLWIDFVVSNFAFINGVLLLVLIVAVLCHRCAILYKQHPVLNSLCNCNIRMQVLCSSFALMVYRFNQINGAQ